MTRRRIRRARVWENRERRGCRARLWLCWPSSRLYVLRYKPSRDCAGGTRRNWLSLTDRVAFTVEAHEPIGVWHTEPFVIATHPDWKSE